MRLHLRILLILAFALLTCSLAADVLQKEFVNPPASARPWVYWFWLNGNITLEGITADLEAMKRVGIGGVLIMEVDQGAPVGPVGFMSPEWRELFKHVASESRRLGLEVNMNNDAGWNGSGGPWIKPEQSMQKVVWSEVDAAGPQHFAAALPQPEVVAGYYRDIRVLAFPTPGTYRIPEIHTKARFAGGHTSFLPQADVTPENVIPPDRMLDISDKIDAEGRLTWDMPEGKWTIVRFGHTSTGARNHPAPASGVGLECDKLSKQGAQAAFDGMMAKLISDVGDNAGKSLVATHVDSWEVGSQNWTGSMRGEFAKRRGYDLLPYLPVFTGRVVGSAEISERFLWDLRKTISEMLVENYAGHIADLAHERGLRFTVEAYGGPCDSLEYAGQSDEPMGEFWNPSAGAIQTCKAMASAGHVYGKRIIGAEAFTSSSDERWLGHPASVKSLGDQAFCLGINRFVFHRYAMQPWEPAPKPGMMMGPWGLHYERTQTWWNESAAWHKYLSRCQHMLRQGLHVADICYVQEHPWIADAWIPLEGGAGRPNQVYQWDQCSPEVVLTRMSVKNGRLVLPDGMSYRVLVLPESRYMTPEFLRKIGDLVRAGAIVIGPRPEKSPSLSGYPECDSEVRDIASEIWGDCDGKQIKEHRLGKGRVIWGKTPEAVLRGMGVGPDFTGSDGLNFVHRSTGTTDIYFVANPQWGTHTVTGTFRVSGKIPELWWPESGRVERAPVYGEKNGLTNVLLPIGRGGSVFVVFRAKDVRPDRIVSVKRNGQVVISLDPAARPRIAIVRATYGVPGDPSRTRDVTGKVRKLLDDGRYGFPVARVAEGDDPAYGVIKTLEVTYSVGDQKSTLRVNDGETAHFVMPPDPCELRDDGTSTKLIAREAGRYTLSRKSGKKSTLDVRLPKPVVISSPWRISFPPNWGAPESIRMDTLVSLSEHTDPGVKYFSGTATYRTTFKAPADLIAKRRVFTLDLGDVQVMARVKLNGKDLGLLWRSPYSIDVTKALKSGANTLEVQVTNLWPNRLIGDEQLPEDSDRHGNGTLRSWPQWVQDGKPSPTGRFTFETWRMWGKDEPLLVSGLIGPVTLAVTQELSIK